MRRVLTSWLGRFLDSARNARGMKRLRLAGIAALVSGLLGAATGMAWPYVSYLRETHRGIEEETFSAHNRAARRQRERIENDSTRSATGRLVWGFFTGAAVPVVVLVVMNRSGMQAGRSDRR